MRVVSHISIVILVLGIALMIGSLVWKPIARSEFLWPAEESELYSQAAAELHAAIGDEHGHDHGHEVTATAHDPDHGSTPTEVLDRFQAAKQRLDAAQRWRDNGGRVLRIAGVISTIAGTIGYYWARSRM